MKSPLIVGLGGTTRDGSSSERAMQTCLQQAEALGARTRFFGGADLRLPMYDPTDPERTDAARELVEALRECDGVIIASPGYHGSVSGLVKNALDYTEDLRDDRRVYLDARPVGLITCALGDQATGSTLSALRAIVHALRGWPTSLGVTINTSRKVFDAQGECVDDGVRGMLKLLARQVVEASQRSMAPLPARLPGEEKKA
ncbi:MULTISPECIES: NADPH-dependent FMN reductase [Pseudomonas]|uniref:FMN reductase n=1 Tax=Pseudomonas frederiksbergensis TaxID=104087 RepID=A0AB33ECR3_9PSED|nr:NAD(P)H-dependent oxidoreductase [Pseudomonas frederiksbergensis]ATE78243.1 FMN reductase [Pseudomonas frederiksbergensis]